LAKGDYLLPVQENEKTSDSSESKASYHADVQAVVASAGG
jgi:hypothetical protein